MRFIRPTLLIALIGVCGCKQPETTAPTGDALLPSLKPDPAATTACSPEGPAAGTARARRVSCDGELGRGALAMGTAGDLLLENARVRAIVRTGIASATTIGAPAGGLVDAFVLSGDRRDGLKEILPMLDRLGLVVGDFSITTASGREAIARAAFKTAPIGLLESGIGLQTPPVPLHGVLEYALSAGEDVVRLRVCAVPDDGAPEEIDSTPGLFALFGGGAEMLVSGAGVLDDDLPSTMGAALYAESPAGAWGVALGGAPEGGRASFLHVDTITLMTGIRRVSFSRRELRCASIRVAVGETAGDVAAMLPEGGAAETREVVVPAGGRLEVAAAAGRLLLRTRERGGKAQILSSWASPLLRVARAGGLFGDPASPPPTGTLLVEPVVTGEPGAPVRITIEGQGGLARQERFVATAPARRALPIGRYRVSASRGMEYTAVSSEITIESGAEARFAPVLLRVIDTAGWIAADFHLHTELSTDSTHPVEDAVRQMAAEGLELVAGTDHDFVSDHQKVIDASDVAGRIRAVPGEEVSTTKSGHIGGYPLRSDPAAAAAGAVPWFDLAPNGIFDSLRARGDGVIVQVNHPRLGSAAFFDAVGLDPATGRLRGDPSITGVPAGSDLSALRFDVLEIWNGYTRGQNEPSFADFLRLVGRGRRLVMVGNSDSHRPDLPPGAPRNYLRVGRGADDPKTIAWPAARKALADGAVVVAAGIFLEVESGGVFPGGTVPEGTVRLRVRVQAPPWVGCNRLRLYRNSAVVEDRAIAAPREPAVRFEGDLDVTASDGDTLVVRADGTGDGAPVFPFAPFAASNPIYVIKKN